jgi:hypothetical protein
LILALVCLENARLVRGMRIRRGSGRLRGIRRRRSGLIVRRLVNVFVVEIGLVLGEGGRGEENNAELEYWIVG